MKRQPVRSVVLAQLVLLTLVTLFTPTLLNANVLAHLKLGKRKHPTTASQTSSKAAPGLTLRLRRAESFPGRLKSGGEPEGGPLAYEREKLANRAYPGTDIPITLTNNASQHFARVQTESEAGTRGAMMNSQWVSIGPSVALYPAVLGRTGAPYVASGRISALAIENNCNPPLPPLCRGGWWWYLENEQRSR